MAREAAREANLEMDVMKLQAGRETVHRTARLSSG